MNKKMLNQTKILNFTIFHTKPLISTNEHILVQMKKKMFNRTKI